jgi:hypothetical protein
VRFAQRHTPQGLFKNLCTNGDSHRPRTVLFPDVRIAQVLPVNQTMAIEFTPTQSGCYEFACGMKMFRGTVAVVTEDEDAIPPILSLPSGAGAVWEASGAELYDDGTAETVSETVDTGRSGPPRSWAPGA